MQPERNLSPVPLQTLRTQPLVSVLLPVYNYEKFVGRAISSALNQTYEHLELIICDDGSTDGSLAIARHFAATDSRVKIVTKEVNSGQAAALNAAYAQHQGEIICILDADDMFLPLKLQRVVQHYLENPDVGVLVHSMNLLDEQERQVETIPFLSHFERGWIAEKVILRGGRWRFMPSSALSFRSELGPFCTPIPEETFRVNAEAYMFTMLPLLTCVGYIREPLSCYRLHDSNMSGALGFSPSTLRYREECMRVPTAAVNEQLRNLGYRARLDLNRNLDYAMIRFKRHMLEPQSLAARLRRYRELVSLAAQDDLLSPGGKSLVILGHLASLFLQRSGREWVFNQMMSPNSLKRLLRALRPGETGVQPASPAPTSYVREC